LFFSCAVLTSSAQTATPAAVQPGALSAFGGLTGTYTGLSGGKNLGITAGADLRVYDFHRYMVSGEVRGTTAIDGGVIDRQKDILAGVRVHRRFNGFIEPYADILIGRGKINYESGGYLNAAQTLVYSSSPSTVISPGGGVDLLMGEQFAVKLDAQFEHWDTPVNTSGTIYAKALTAGIVYRFNFNRGRPR
jgi:hypothetical protein